MIDQRLPVFLPDEAFDVVTVPEKGPIFSNHNYTVPESILGYWSNWRFDPPSVEVEWTQFQFNPKIHELGAAGTIEAQGPPNARVAVFRLLEISVIAKPKIGGE